MLSGKYLKPAFVPVKGEAKNKKDGYYQVWLRHTNLPDGTSQRRWHKVHRLVAECFVVNYKPSAQVDVIHIDGDTLHNKWTNLKWAEKGKRARKKKKGVEGDRGPVEVVEKMEREHRYGKDTLNVNI